MAVRFHLLVEEVKGPVFITDILVNKPDHPCDLTFNLQGIQILRTRRAAVG